MRPPPDPQLLATLKTTDRSCYFVVMQVSKGEKTKAQIIDQALRMSQTVGLEGLTFGELAAALDISKSGLFSHFPSKEDLQLEVIQALVDRFIAKIIQPAFTKARGEPRIRALFDRYIEWVGSNDVADRGCLLTQLQYEFQNRRGPVRNALTAAEKSWFETLTKACRIATDEKHFKSTVDPEQFAYELLGIFTLYQHAARFFEDPRGLQRATAAFAGLIERSRAKKS
jgi:AcrR family transcriptional regulator